MKRKILAVGLVVILVVLMVGCGGGSSNLNGRWEYQFAGEYNFWEFSGNRFTRSFEGRLSRGTFSVTGDQIELVFESGDISVRSFSRTENTITVGNDRYNRVN